MHLVDVEHGFMGATGVVGGNIPMALGSALAARLRGATRWRSSSSATAPCRPGHFNESVNLATLWELPADLRLREQRLRRVHAALGAHEGGAGQRRGGALRDRARDRGRQRRGRGVRGVRALPRGGARGAAGRSCSSASPTACAATTRATRPSTARRSRRRTGRRRTRCCASSGAAWTRAGSTRRPRRRSSARRARPWRRRWSSAAPAPSRRPSSAAELTYA